MDGDVALRLFLPAYFVAYVLILGPLRVRAFRRKYGFDPTALQAADPFLARQERMRDALFGVILVLTFANAAWPSVHGHLGPISLLDRVPMRVAGVVLLVASLIIISTAQGQLGRSWRYGVDHTHPPDGIVRGGLFSLSRNPIFLGMLLTALGLFLALPNAITASVLAVTYVMLSMRITAEEEFLSTMFGVEYDEYRKQVPRWLVGFGR